MATIKAIDADQKTMCVRTGMRRISPAMIAAAFIRLIVDRAEKRRSRSALLELTDDQLRDVGLTRSDVRREAAKSYFWD